jgi:hypothetical protein
MGMQDTGYKSLKCFFDQTFFSNESLSENLCNRVVINGGGKVA